MICFSRNHCQKFLTELTDETAAIELVTDLLEGMTISLSRFQQLLYRLTGKKRKACSQFGDLPPLPLLERFVSYVTESLVDNVTFLLTWIPQASNTDSAVFAVKPLAVRSTRRRWMSVTPDTILYLLRQHFS
jgi:hypothetical protein